jgi:prepilin-type processing-associated H-X9-DG protein
MNGKGWLSRAMHKTMGEVQQPDERFVFIDCGGTELIAMGGWTCYPDGREQWWDPPPIRHNDGTVFSFADGHVAYRQWEDARTIEFGKRMVAFSEVQPGNQDIEDTQRGVWGTATDESTEPGRRR